MNRSALILLAPALLFGCGDARRAEIADVQSYVAQAKIWGPTEADAAVTIGRILQTQFIDEAEVRRQISHSRPRLRFHLETIQSYAPRSKSVARIHRRYVAAWENLLSGYDAVERGFETGDYHHLAEGRAALERWRQEIVGVASDLRQLLDHLRVETTARLGR